MLSDRKSIQNIRPPEQFRSISMYSRVSEVVAHSYGVAAGERRTDRSQRRIVCSSTRNGMIGS